MADRSVRFDFIGRDKSAGKTMAGLASQTDSLGSKLAGFGKTAAVAFAATGAAVTAGIGKSISMAADFDKTIRKVGVATSQSGEGLKQLSDLALKMGKDTIFSAGEASAAMLELAKGGFSAAQIKAGALEGVMTLAAAAEIGMADAATFLGNTLNTFGLKAEDSNRVVSALAGGANASSASVESLGLALSQVGPSAKLAGASVEETVGILAAFDNAGVKGSDAGTSLKTMFARLVPQTDAAADAMRKLGLDFTNAQGGFLPMRDIAEQLRVKLAGLSAEQKTVALNTIFGSDAFRAAAIMADLGAAGVDKYTKAASDQSAAQEMANVQMQGASGQMEAFRGAVETLAIKLGIALLPAFTAVLDFINDEVLPGIDGLVDKFGGFADDIVPKVQQAIGAVTDTFDEMDLADKASNIYNQAKNWATNVITGVQDGIETGDWSGLGESIGTAVAKAGDQAAALGNAVIEWASHVDWFNVGLEIGTQAWSLLTGVAVGILKFDLERALVGLADNWFTVLIGVISLALLPARVVASLSRILLKIPLFGKFLSWGLESMVGLSKGLVSGIGKALQFMGKGFLDGFRKVFPGIGAAFAQWLSLLPTRIGLANIAVIAKAKALVVGLGNGIKSGAGWVAAKIGEIIGLIVRPFASAGSWLFGHGRNLISGLGSGIANMFRWIGGKIGEIKNVVVGAAARAKDWLFDAGVQVIVGFIAGIGSMFGSVRDKLGDLGSKLTSWKGPPSKDRVLLKPVGKLVIAGFTAGMESEYSAVRRSLAGLTDSLVPDVGTTAGQRSSAGAAQVSDRATYLQPLNLSVDGVTFAQILLRLERNGYGISVSPA